MKLHIKFEVIHVPVFYMVLSNFPISIRRILKAFTYILPVFRIQSVALPCLL